MLVIKKRKENKIILVLLTVFLLNVMVLLMNAQEPGKIESGCKRIDPKKPSVYIKYEGWRREATGDDFILLRVINNTTLDLKFATDGNYYRWVDGKYMPYVEDGEEADVYYYYEVFVKINKAIKKSLKLPYNYLFLSDYVSYMLPHVYRDFFHSFVLKAGRSFIFKVPFDYYRKGYYINIFFEFLWEGDLRNSDDRFKVDYSWSDVPEELKKRK